MMVIILYYYLDGSGRPRLEFIESGPHQTERVAESLRDSQEDWSDIYIMESLNRAPIKIPWSAE